MKTSFPVMALSALILTLNNVSAGELNGSRDRNVADSVVTRPATPESRGTRPQSRQPKSKGGVDLNTPVLDFRDKGTFFRYTLTNHTEWVFTNHAMGKQIWLQVTQDAEGGWTNSWPADLLWPGGQTVNGSTTPNHFTVFTILDNGKNWLALGAGSDYSAPCEVNCSYALQFDGSHNFAEAANDPAFSTPPLTLELWFRYPASPNGGVLFSSIPMDANSSITGPGGIGVGAFVGGDSSLVAFSAAGVRVINSGSFGAGYDDGEWHHLAVIITPSEYRIYLDGTNNKSGSWSGAALTTSQPFRFGRGNFGGGSTGVFGSNAIIDEFRISKVARYNSSFTPTRNLTVDSQTVAYWKFNEGSGTTVHDATGDHDAVLQGNPTPEWVEGR